MSDVKGARSVLFVDIGGVCCDNPYRVMSAEIERRFGIPAESAMPVFIREAKKLDSGSEDFREFQRNVVSSLDLPLDFDEFEAMHDASLSLKKEVCTLLGTVRKNGTRLIALSNMPEYTWKLLERKYALAEMFDDAVLSYQHSIIKPDPAIFEVAIGRAGVPPEESSFVDDNAENVEVASGKGIESILFTSLDQLQEELRSRGLIPHP